jgi:2-polyprenyl-3-methyl-5-hydroxy-6-metoxy-1,4-benzoquinol methylase
MSETVTHTDAPGMSATFEHVSRCSLCAGTQLSPAFKSEDHFTGEMFTLARCNTCGFVCTSPRPTPEQLGRYYPPTYYGEEGRRFHGPLEKIVQWFRNRLADKISKHTKGPGKVLEIGSGRGTLLAELAKRGWGAYGTEFSDTLAEASTNSLGVTVYTAPDLRDCNFEDGFFDVIICYHVLEHMPNPAESLKEMERIISPNGLLLTAVPNFGGVIAQWTQGMWFAVDAPRHLGHYSPETLTKALHDAGFEISTKKTLSIEQDVFGFAQSVMNMLGMPYNIFYDLIRNADAKMRHGDADRPSRWRSIAVLFAGALFSGIGLPVMLFLALIKSGGTLEYWAHPAPKDKQGQ